MRRDEGNSIFQLLLNGANSEVDSDPAAQIIRLISVSSINQVNKCLKKGGDFSSVLS